MTTGVDSPPLALQGVKGKVREKGLCFHPDLSEVGYSKFSENNFHGLEGKKGGFIPHPLALIPLEVKFIRARPCLGWQGAGTPRAIPRGSPQHPLGSDNVGFPGSKFIPGMGKGHSEGLVTPKSATGPFPAGGEAMH